MPTVVLTRGESAQDAPHRRRNLLDRALPVCQAQQVFPLLRREGETRVGGDDDGDVVQREPGSLPGAERPACNVELLAEKRSIHDTIAVFSRHPAQLPWNERLLRDDLNGRDAVAKPPEHVLDRVGKYRVEQVA